MDYETLVHLHTKWKRLAAIATVARYPNPFHELNDKAERAWQDYRHAVRVYTDGKYFPTPEGAKSYVQS